MIEEAALIRSCQLNLRNLFRTRHPIRPLIEEMRLEYGRLFTKPQMKVYFHNIQIKAAIEAKDEPLLKDLLANGMAGANVITLNMMLHYYVQLGQVEHSEMILRRAIQEGRLFLNLISFSTLICAYGEMGKWEKMLEWCHELKRYRQGQGNPPGLLPNQSLLAKVIHTLSQLGHFEHADGLLEAYEGRIEWEVWKVLLEGLIKRGYYDKARGRYLWLTKEYYKDQSTRQMPLDMLKMVPSREWKNELISSLGSDPEPPIK